MNTRLIFLGFLSVIMAFYLKVQADGFGFPDGQLTDLERAQLPLNYIFSIVVGFLGLVLFYLAWKPPIRLKPNILSQGATALYLLLLLIFISVNYILENTFNSGTGG